MFAINVGDSHCILGQRKGGEERKGGEKICLEISIDQKPMRDYEKKRIQEKGEKSVKKSQVSKSFLEKIMKFLV